MTPPIALTAFLISSPLTKDWKTLRHEKVDLRKAQILKLCAYFRLLSHPGRIFSRFWLLGRWQIILLSFTLNAFDALYLVGRWWGVLSLKWVLVCVLLSIPFYCINVFIRIFFLVSVHTIFKYFYIFWVSGSLVCVWVCEINSITLTLQ